MKHATDEDLAKSKAQAGLQHATDIRDDDSISTKQTVDEGVAEVWLSSEDTGAYGIDLQTSLSALLLRLIPVLEKRPFASLRVGMTNPPYVLDQLDTLAEVMEHPQIYAFLHVPVQ